MGIYAVVLFFKKKTNKIVKKSTDKMTAKILRKLILT
jgi:hypothetical protein